MSKTQQTAGEKPRIGEQEVRRAAELLKKYRQGKVNLERRIIDNEQFWKLRHWPQMEKTGEGGNPGDPQPTSGWLVNCILSKHADAMDCYPEPTVLPREPGDRAEAAKLTRILPAILKKNQFKRTYSSAEKRVRRIWRVLGCGQAQRTGGCVYPADGSAEPVLGAGGDGYSGFGQLLLHGAGEP